jgi:late competence protein required for DNA uptake (superfamily II DNA/RNA helicase)
VNTKDEELPFCRYFENGVLPIEQDLEMDYKEERDILVGRVIKSKVKCERCGDKIETNSNRQKYCEKCKTIKRKEQVRLAVQKKRDMG